MPIYHIVRVWREFFDSLQDLNKKFEIYKDGHVFRVGDILYLVEWDTETEERTGRGVFRTITHVIEFWGQRNDMVRLILKHTPINVDRDK